MPTRVFVNILQARSLPVMDRSTGLCDAYVKPQLKGVTFDPVQTQVMHISAFAFGAGRHLARSTARLFPQMVKCPSRAHSCPVVLTCSFMQ